MSSLPDDVLLRILRLLDARQLLRVRAVSCRWKDLALQPELWRHQGAGVGCLAELHEFTAILRRAPCLEYIDVDFHGPRVNHSAVMSSLIGTACAAEYVTLYTVGVRDAARVLRRQAALGRLSGVTLMLKSYFPEADICFPELLRVICTAGIDHFVLKDNFSSRVNIKPQDIEAANAILEKFVASVSFKPSLKTMQIPNDYKRNALCTLLLRAHAASLEDVSLIHRRLSSIPLFTGFPVLPSLRRLEGPLLEDMTVLLQCPSLETLEIKIDSEVEIGPGSLASAAKFICRVSSLHKLVFRTKFQQEAPSPALQDILSVLGVSCCSSLEWLSLDLKYADLAVHSLELPRALAAALPGLPRLRRLTLRASRCPQDAMSEVVAAAPQTLQVLSVEFVTFCLHGRNCVHAFSHRCEVRRALQMNPGLHLRLAGHCIDVDLDCPHCTAGCHPELSKQGIQYFVLYTHGDAQPCPLHDETEWVFKRLAPSEVQTQCAGGVDCSSCGDGL